MFPGGVVDRALAGSREGGSLVPVLREDLVPAELCDRRDLPVLLELDRAAIDSIGRTFSDHNTAIMTRADSLRRAGYFGPADSEAATVDARRYVQLRTWNAMHTISHLTALHGGVARMQGDGHFLPLIEGFFSAAMYPLRNVEVARVGEGAFCLRYVIPDGYEESFAFGHLVVRVRTHETRDAEGRPLRVFSREWASGDGKIELLFENLYTGRVRRESIVDRGDRLDLLVFFDLDGLYVRKHGTHRLSGMAVWRSVVEGDEVPANPRLGAVAYFPNIDIDLPWFLPDVGLEDLRDFAYPAPLLGRDVVAARAQLPAWLGLDDTGQLEGWNTVGPRPKVLDEIFPDR